ncbi:MAG: hypothetical protein F9K10_02320 [Paludibacter sp.]|nr:MAG: hypothetical protein F9K10_02320 [Paludibacter sp.]
MKNMSFTNRLQLHQILPLLVLFVLVSCQSKPDFADREQNFDSGWRFQLGDVPGAETATFDDSQWRQLDLPHDWSIEDLPTKESKKQIGPFSENSEGKGATGNVMGGTGWYRKTFTLDKSSAGKKVQILFDGVYMNSEVWINGQSLGVHPYGYTPFYYDLTPHLNPSGEKNTLAVKVNNHGKNSRWYSGSGIYRHVDLIVTEKIHLPVWGIFVTTPEVSAEKALVKLNIKVINDTKAKGKLEITTHLISPEGQLKTEAKTTVLPFEDQSLDTEQIFELVNPAL